MYNNLLKMDDKPEAYAFFYRYDVEKVFEGVERYMVPTLMDRLNETLNILMNDNSSINAFNNKIYTYVMLDWRVDAWKPIMITVEGREKLFVRKLSTNAVAFRNMNDTDLPRCSIDVNGIPFIDCTGKKVTKNKSTSIIFVSVFFRWN